MSHTTHLHRALTAAACISAALCLSACGGSSKSGSQAGSHTSTAAARSSSATQTSSGTAATATDSTTTTTATRSLSPAKLAQAQRATLTSFAACLREHGIHVPPQHLSGANPTFNLKGLDTKTARYQRAGTACLRVATSVYSSATAAGR